jgi:translation initiation factor IF-2
MEEEAKSEPDEEEIGKVTHFFPKVSAAGIEITAGTLKVGDTIHIKGHTSDFTQAVDSMQVENQAVEEAKVGDLVGIKTKERAREHDVVYKAKS